MDIIHIQLLF